MGLEPNTALALASRIESPGDRAWRMTIGRLTRDRISPNAVSAYCQIYGDC